MVCGKEYIYSTGGHTCNISNPCAPCFEAIYEASKRRIDALAKSCGDIASQTTGTQDTRERAEDRAYDECKRAATFAAAKGTLDDIDIALIASEAIEDVKSRGSHVSQTW